MEEKEKKIDEILSRGTIVQVLPDKDSFRAKLLGDEKMRFYIGFDPTAPTLHLSHAKNIMLLEKFRRLGHEVIVLFGDFTARIGDPTGEKGARKQLSAEAVSANVSAWRKLIEPLMDFEDSVNPPQIRYNNEWLSKLTFEEVVGLASQFTVQQMLERDMFERRIEAGEPVHLHEFLYPLMQGYDSVVLDADVELCGTDQIFNALAGRTLLKKMKNKEKFVVAVTLMENPKTGELMSKSQGTGVFLDTEPNEKFGQVMAQPDEMIEILFTHCTLLSLPEIQEIMRALNPRDAKLRLAEEIVSLYHGKEASVEAKKYFIETFSEKKIPENISEFSPIYEPALEGYENLDSFVSRFLGKSKSEVRRTREQGGLEIGGEKTVETRILNKEDDGKVLKFGKKDFVKIVFK